ncbi:hypothetical protein, partial [Streptomyces benahoarensis]
LPTTPGAQQPAVQRKAAPLTPRPTGVPAEPPAPVPQAQAQAQTQSAAAPALPNLPPLAIVQRTPEQGESGRRPLLAKSTPGTQDTAPVPSLVIGRNNPAPERNQPREQPPKRASARNRHTPKESSGKRSAGREGAEFDARTLTDGQVDELVHRLTGLLIPRLKAEFRHDRERIGRLRDPRR